MTTPFPNRLLKHTTCPSCNKTTVTKSTTSLPISYYVDKGCSIDSDTSLPIITRNKHCTPSCNN